jgi:DNA-binding CsgD family transcriptional regulator
MQRVDRMPEELTAAVYGAALDPLAWNDVMQSMQRSFPSVAQTFYLLHMRPHRIQPVSLVGIEPTWVRNFDALYFAADNPWIRLTGQLHRPGVVRTNERLDRFLRQRGALYRSSYYNEWMRPQGFKYTIGNTLLAEDGIVANVTLMRAPDMKTFGAAEVRAFELLSRHMTRALQMSIRLGRTEASATSTAVLDALPRAVAIVGAQHQLLYANAAMEALLRRGDGLALRQGRLCATRAESQRLLAERIAAALSPTASSAAAPADAQPLRLHASSRGPLGLTVIPLVGRVGQTLIARPTVLLMASDETTPPRQSVAAICQRHHLTATEGRLAELLARGRGLRDAAQAMGITYGTARGYLKTVFEKTGVHTQAQLVARLLAQDGSAAAH